ncbi:MAG: fumarylacetoacetate hydrolase family protein, partial [Chloroflexota bacterium]
MKFVTFQHKDGSGNSALGILDNQQVKEIDFQGSMIELIAASADGKGPEFAETDTIYRAADVKFKSPVERPGKVIALGRNYAAHAAEGGAKPPDFPMLFHKTHTSLTGHGRPIVLPDPQLYDRIDYEAELAVVMGKPCKNVSEAEALDYVFGYTVANDISARTLQRRTSQFTAGKMLDTFCPLG